MTPEARLDIKTGKQVIVTVGVPFHDHLLGGRILVLDPDGLIFQVD